MFDTLDISASALQAQRIRMDSIAQNVASTNITRDPSGRKIPFARRFAVFTSGRDGDRSRPGVSVEIKQDHSERLSYEPWHPDADRQGNVHYPNIDLAIEMVNMIEASRAYEANVTTMDVTKSMLNASLRLIA